MPNSQHRRHYRSFENMVKFKYFRTTETIQNLFRENIKSKLNFVNACHHSVQYLLPLVCSLNQNLELNSFYGCETWSLTLREEHKPKAFEKRMPRRIF
ncbi:hypothetical protein B7P43_G06543 [Cryptotermes secundus]|uniref:Uncharacterized protein n=1 Tax=Cryptotermes secundus TaxID=105785 RepID=A0A2J7RHH7_9NEOP|nr:hypothetical protein B7P43_G06543 [Cryptotermes secundus]